jgi:N-acetylglucosamine-6-phosphate deacetylase
LVILTKGLNTKGQMTPSLNIINARVPGYQGLQQIGIDAQGTIEAITSIDSASPVETIPELSIIDVAGDWVSLGGVDLQINGGLGLAFTDLSPSDSNQLGEICQFLWHQGVDAFLPTLVTTSVENIQRSLAVFAAFMASQGKEPATAQI